MSKKKVDPLVEDINSLLNNCKIQSFNVDYNKHNLKISIPIFSICGMDLDAYGQSGCVETNFQNNMSLINLEEINKTIRKSNPVISSFKISNEFNDDYNKHNLKISIPIFSICGMDLDAYGQSGCVETNFQNNMSLINLEEINKTIRKSNPVISSFKISNEFNDDCFGNGYVYTMLEYKFNDFVKAIENSSSYYYDVERKIEDNTLKFYFEYSGASGGNCWGTSAESFNNEIDVDEIIKNIDNFMSNFLKVSLGNNSFKNIKHKVSKKNVSEYYGNYSNFIVFEFDLQDVYNEFKNIYDNLIFG